KIGVGMITPHMDAGYSGGAKIILPGVCSGLTVDTFHAREADVTRNQLGDMNASVRRDLEQFVGERVGLDFILNVVLTADEEIYQCVAGDFIEAHRVGVTYAQEVYGSPAEKRYPIIIANAYPTIIDLWQSSKGIWCGELLVEDGGTIILVTPAIEGHGVYPLFGQYIGQDPDTLKQRLDADEAEDPKAAAIGYLVGRMKERINFAIVSTGLGQADASAMGFAYYETVEAAITETVKHYSGSNIIGVLTHAGVTLPLIKS
ncbi:MAG: lactate racemase domain-containing protein, partial [Chloroflexota bacterium]